MNEKETFLMSMECLNGLIAFVIAEALRAGAMVVNVAKILRNSVAGVLIAAMPITTTAAAVRPNAAVPTAGSTAVTAQGQEQGFAAAWAALAIIALAIIIAIWIMVDRDSRGRGSLSRA